jgi:Tol biopolymer transport system component
VLSAGRVVAFDSPQRAERASKAVSQLVEQLRKQPPRPAKASNRMSLYALDVATGEAILVAGEPDPGLDQCGCPSWTQDGKRILFDAMPRDQIAKTRLKAIDLADGRWAIKDLGPGNCPTPSPTADRIIFLPNPDQMPNAETGVWIMQADGSQRRRLGGYGRPRWSPDGHQFLIISFSSPAQVTVIDDRPGKKSGEVHLAGQRVYSIPSWAGEGTIVAVIGAEGNEAGDTVALLNLADPEQTTTQEVLWKKGSGLAVNPSEPIYSPITRRCVFVGSDPKGMALYSAEQGKSGPPRRIELEGYDNLIRDLAFSPDGRYILFASNRPDRPVRQGAAGDGKTRASAGNR